MKLTKWEDLEDKSIGHWRPILSGDWSLVEVSHHQGLIPAATGYMEYYFGAEWGKVCRY
ncbi:Nuclear transport factor 2 (NTF2) family protein [Zea mays]|uniref:Nuclear transport factor 2 (NTF2) family protein n=1 Tax=Zea mays TaxID=4577 RepID=A0A1D6KJU6_MAIZE|nr:Nuclear transport factor 2 (NTF2) family protein [Zea mays]